ncbi:hypothetical protein [Simkania sp.]|uniref:hypothetical protein n=1 Tax=Simkania sp. TaxID=34094 RepID=UPI003B52D8CF
MSSVGISIQAPLLGLQSNLRNQLLGHLIFGNLKAQESTLWASGIDTFINTLFTNIVESAGGDIARFEAMIGATEADASLEKVRKAFIFVVGQKGFDTYSEKLQAKSALHCASSQPSLIELWTAEAHKTSRLKL